MNPKNRLLAESICKKLEILLEKNSEFDDLTHNEQEIVEAESEKLIRAIREMVIRLEGGESEEEQIKRYTRAIRVCLQRILKTRNLDAEYQKKYRDSLFFAAALANVIEFFLERAPTNVIVDSLTSIIVKLQKE